MAKTTRKTTTEKPGMSEAEFFRMCRWLSEITHRAGRLWSLGQVAEAVKDGQLTPLTHAENVADLELLVMLRDVSRMPRFQEALDRAILFTRRRLGLPEAKRCG